MSHTPLCELVEVFAEEGEAADRRNDCRRRLIDACGDKAGVDLVSALLAEHLGSRIRGLARKVAKNALPYEADDFVDGALSLLLAPSQSNPLPAVLRFVPGHASLGTYLHRVLSNQWVSERRKARRRGGPAGVVVQSSPALDQLPDRPTGAHLQQEAPYGDGTLAELEHLSARDRLEMLCLLGLWHKVPLSRWEKWMAEYEGARSLCLPRPFPPESVLRALCRSESAVAPWAQVLGYQRPNSLVVRWLRLQQRLRERPAWADILAG